MEDSQKKLRDLEVQLNELHEREMQLRRDFAELKKQLAPDSQAPIIETKTDAVSKPILNSVAEKSGEKPADASVPADYNTERYIGENLSGKIGIVIMLVGVALGVKYAIDHSVLSPVMRYAIGNFWGLLFSVSGWVLRKKYPLFGSVLASGGLAVLFLMTWVGFSLQHVLNLPVTYLLLLLLTIASSVMSKISRVQAMAVVALLGGYLVAVFSGNSEKDTIFILVWMGLMNAAMLLLSYYQNWLLLRGLTFVLTWFSFVFLYAFHSHTNQFLNASIFFSFLYYLMGYASSIANYLYHKKPLERRTVAMLLLNAFVSYMAGKMVLDGYTNGEYNGIFTLCHAFSHLGFALFIRRKQLIEAALKDLLTGLFVAFVSISVLVQFDGSIVTLMWSSEAAILLVLAIRHSEKLFGQLAMLLFLCTIISLSIDWNQQYGLHDFHSHIKPIRWVRVATGLFVVSTFWLPAVFGIGNQNDSEFLKYSKPVLFGLGYLILICLYFLELMDDAALQNHKLYGFAMYLFHIGTLLLSAIMCLITFPKQAEHLRKVANGFALGMLLVSLVYFLFSWLDSFPGKNATMMVAVYRVLIYLAYLLVLVVLARTMAWIYGITAMLLVLFLLLVGSSEWGYFMYRHPLWELSERFGISIWWAIMSMSLIIAGIRFKQEYLRTWALVLFGITLFKVVFYDTRELDAGPKTILYLSLGLLLLLVSYLYNRFKTRLFGVEKEPSDSAEH